MHRPTFKYLGENSDFFVAKQSSKAELLSSPLALADV